MVISSILDNTITVSAITAGADEGIAGLKLLDDTALPKVLVQLPESVRLIPFADVDNSIAPALAHDW